MTPNDYFTHIICINLRRRPDRLEKCVEQFERFGLRDVILFKGHDVGAHLGNDGCTASHRGVLELISHHRWERTLILEDDFQIIDADFNEKFAAMIGEVPENWEMLYLGGHYAENPKERVAPHVIRCGHMKTTSSYAVTHALARRMAPFIYGGTPIDELYHRWNNESNCYIFDPRLMVQRAGYSDIQQREMDNSGCMMDSRHASMV